MKHLKVFEGKNVFSRKEMIARIKQETENAGGAMVIHDIPSVRGNELTFSTIDGDDMKVYKTVNGREVETDIAQIGDDTLAFVIDQINLDNEDRKNRTAPERTDVDGLRDMMGGAARRNPLPKRFKADESKSPKITITDTETGRSTTVGLYAYGDVRKVLNDLFGDGK